MSVVFVNTSSTKATDNRRFGRNVKHDPRSVQYPYLSENVGVESVLHQPTCAVFDQGTVGSCTANAALTVLSCMTDAVGGRRTETFTQRDAVELYSEATKLDDFQGDYPPNDTGSDGLSVSKALHHRGWISGYRHVLSGAMGVAMALQHYPVIVGLPWYSSMSSPDKHGHVYVAHNARMIGGHEVAIIGYDVVEDSFRFRNSWGESWGMSGDGTVSRSLLDRLLGEQGDATVFTPAGADAPYPLPDPDTARLAGKLDPWLRQRFPGIGASKARNHILTYLSEKGVKAVS